LFAFQAHHVAPPTGAFARWKVTFFLMQRYPAK
jgi:hypothetical protein